MTLEQRRTEARQRVARWRADSGEGPQLRIHLPRGPGSDLLFDGLSENLAAIGVSTQRAAEPDAADIVLRDRVARYASPRWFLNQFNCAVSRGACSEDADYLVSLALDARDGVEAASYLYEAETALLAINRYIPLGAPIRWSLVRADIEAFAENPWNIHPLFPLSRAPI
jgi:ABC-type oligopeptide transport system substrate-binding subunit